MISNPFSFNSVGGTTKALVISKEIYPWLDYHFNWIFTE